MSGIDNAPEVKVRKMPLVIVQGSEHKLGTYLAANLNPKKEKFDESLHKAQFTIFDIGCGKEPRLSWKLNALDLWVGCDPAMKSEGESGMVHRGIKTVSTDAELDLFSSPADEVPTFFPDVISVVAPNQKDIVDDKIFNDDLRKFLSSEKPQSIVIVLDKRTQEAATYQRQAKRAINVWMAENGFRLDEDNPVMDRFRANSADLGETNIRVCFTRNPKHKAEA